MTLMEAFWFAVRHPWYRMMLLACFLTGVIIGSTWSYAAYQTWLELAADAAAYAEEQR